MRMIHTIKESILSICVSAAILLIAGSVYVGIREQLTGQMTFIFGYKPIYIESGSMEPVIRTGDIVLMRKCGYEDVAEGDIITFRTTQGYVTHRLIGIDTEALQAGHTQYLITKGDANEIADPARLDPENIEGVIVNIWNRKGDDI